MRFLLFLLAPVLTAMPAAAQRVTVPTPSGFVVGYEGRQGGNTVRELVPRGESVHDYRRMISAHRMAGLGRVPSPKFVAEWGKRYAAACPGARTTMLPFAGLGAGGVRVDCTRHPRTGKPETVLARAVNAGPDMMLVFVTFRYLPAPREAQWAREQLGTVAIVH